MGLIRDFGRLYAGAKYGGKSGGRADEKNSAVAQDLQLYFSWLRRLIPEIDYKLYNEYDRPAILRQFPNRRDCYSAN